MAERQARVLGRLTEICMDIAEALRAQVLERTADVPAEKPSGAGAVCRDPELAISRIARAVRLNLVLEARLAQARAAKAAPWDVLGALGLERPRLELTPGFVRKDVVRDVVERTIEAEAYESDEACDVEDLLDEAYERVDACDEAEYLARPIGEMVERVCKDMDLTPDWSFWADQDWAIAEAEAKTPGSPYAAAAKSGPNAAPAANADPP